MTAKIFICCSLSPSKSSVTFYRLCDRCSDRKCLNQVLKRICSKNVAQRRNAVDVVAELIHITFGSVDTLSQEEWYVANLVF